MDLKNLKRPELLKLAKAKGFTGYSKLKVDDLRHLIKTGVIRTSEKPKTPKEKPKTPKEKPKAPKEKPKTPKEKPKTPKEKPKTPKEPVNGSKPFESLSIEELVNYAEKNNMAKSNLGDIRRHYENQTAIPRDPRSIPFPKGVRPPEVIKHLDEFKYVPNFPGWWYRTPAAAQDVEFTLFVLRYYAKTPSQIQEANRSILESCGKITDPKFLNNVYQGINEHFFYGQLIFLFEIFGIRISFVWSNKLSIAAGVCKKRGCEVQIDIARKVIDDLFSKKEKSHSIGGLLCKTKEECALNIVQHELVHALLFAVLRGAAAYKSHGQEFKDIVKSNFGHTDIRHSLFEGDGEELETKKDGSVYFIGEKVKVNVKGVTKTGTILNKWKQGSKTIQLDIGGKHYRYPLIHIEKL